MENRNIIQNYDHIIMFESKNSYRKNEEFKEEKLVRREKAADHPRGSTWN